MITQQKLEQVMQFYNGTGFSGDFEELKTDVARNWCANNGKELIELALMTFSPALMVEAHAQDVEAAFCEGYSRRCENPPPGLEKAWIKSKARAKLLGKC